MLAGCILLISILLNLFFVYFKFIGTGETEVVRIYVDGEIYREIPLEESGEYVIETPYGKNTVCIFDNKVAVTDADCSNRDCVKMGKISHVNDFICCLPHRLYVVIEGGDNKEYDTVTY